MERLWGVGLRQSGVLWADEAGEDFGAGVLFSQGSNPVRGGWQSGSAPYTAAGGESLGPALIKCIVRGCTQH